MAKVINLAVLNPADKTRMYAVASGNGAPTDTDDPIISDVRTFPACSQYTDLTGKHFYVRMATEKSAADWVKVNGE